jgi:hypothetical protein
MIRQIAYYRDKLGFQCLAPPANNPDKYEDELLDAYLHIEDAGALHSEYSAKGVEFSRGFVIKPATEAFSLSVPTSHKVRRTRFGEGRKTSAVRDLRN